MWGLILFNYKDIFIKKVIKKWLINCCGLCLLAGMLGIMYLKFKPVVFWGDYLLKIILGVAIIIFILGVNTKVKIGNKISIFLGNVSYEIYLLHGLIFGIVSHIMPQMPSGLFIAISLAVTVILSAMVKPIADKIVVNMEMAINDKG